MALLSVVVPTLNSVETIRQNLSSLFANDFSRDCYEVIIVDGGSTDGTLRVVSDFPVKVVSCQRKGIGVARNTGIAEAKYGYVCFVDSDSIISHDYLPRISGYFDSHPEVDGIGGPVLPWLYDGVNDWSRYIEEIYLGACDFPTKESTIGPREEVWTHTLKGPNFAFKKAALFSVNGFEETVRGEDIEICWRLVENGKELRFLPDLKVFHYIPGTLHSIFRHSFLWGVDCRALRTKYPKNPLTLFSETSDQKRKRRKEGVEAAD